MLVLVDLPSEIAQGTVKLRELLLVDVVQRVDLLRWIIFGPEHLTESRNCTRPAKFAWQSILRLRTWTGI